MEANTDPAFSGALFVISSPSGGGKGTLIKRVLQDLPRISCSVSWTTRAPRPGEQSGRDYHFVTRETFEAMQSRGEFLESAVVHNHLYGTGVTTVRRELASGRDIILEIDVQGAAMVRGLFTTVNTIFILPPSFQVLRERLSSRESENEESLVLRLRNSRAEMERYHEFDYLVLNDDEERASCELSAIITSEHAKRYRREQLARQVLASFPESP